MANIASYYWCAMKSYLGSKKDELMFFGAYLQDRVSYSQKLGYIEDLPKSADELLAIGDDVKFDDIEKLLRERAEKIKGIKVTYDADI